MSKDSYFEMVYYVTSMIPSGRVSTYGAIADYLTLGSARMVGWALNQCHKDATYTIPAHRVVNRKGELSGRVHFKPSSKMQELLQAEGVRVHDHVVRDFKQLFWHPRELDKD